MNYFKIQVICLFIIGSYVISTYAQNNLVQNDAATPSASNFAYPQSLFIDSYSGHIWVADFDNNRIMRFNVSTLTSLDELQTLALPSGFYLGQNYPNPFNPVTSISFSVRMTGEVKLEVYNLIGQKVAVLFDEIATANTIYSIQYNANNLASGIYLYSLRTSNGIEVKKMCLLK